MTDKPSQSDNIRATVQKARAMLKERGGMAIEGKAANDNRRQPNEPRKPKKPDDQ